MSYTVVLPSLCYLLFTKKLFALLDTGLDGVLAWLPVSWANFTVLVNKLKSLDQPQNLVNRSSDWQIVDGDLPEVVGLVDDEETSVADALVRDHHSVFFTDVVVGVRQEWDVHVTDAALFSGLLGPGEVGEVGVGGAGEYFATQFFELVGSI